MSAHTGCFGEVPPLPFESRLRGFGLAEVGAASRSWTTRWQCWEVVWAGWYAGVLSNFGVVSGAWWTLVPRGVKPCWVFLRVTSICGTLHALAVHRLSVFEDADI